MNGWYVSQGRPHHAGLPGPGATSRSTTRSPTPTRSATPTTARCSARPARTAPTCGAARSTRSSKHGTFIAYNGGDELGRNLLWESYAETLQKAGVSWKVYQGSDDYGDNGLEYFKTFAEYDPAQGGTARSRQTSSTTTASRSCRSRTTRTRATPTTWPTRSASRRAGRHAARRCPGSSPTSASPSTRTARPTDGAYYVHEVLKALNADPDVFNSTLVIINYDENDGQFDHVPPPVPAPGEPTSSYRAPTCPGTASRSPLPVGPRLPGAAAADLARGRAAAG